MLYNTTGYKNVALVERLYTITGTSGYNNVAQGPMLYVTIQPDTITLL
jgi:hypothetical protein